MIQIHLDSERYEKIISFKYDGYVTVITVINVISTAAISAFRTMQSFYIDAILYTGKYLPVLFLHRSPALLVGEFKTG